MDMHEFELEWGSDPIVVPIVAGELPLEYWDPPLRSDRVDLGVDPRLSTFTEFDLEAELEALMLDLAQFGEMAQFGESEHRSE